MFQFFNELLHPFLHTCDSKPSLYFALINVLFIIIETYENIHVLVITLNPLLINNNILYFGECQRN